MTCSARRRTMATTVKLGDLRHKRRLRRLSCAPIRYLVIRKSCLQKYVDGFRISFTLNLLSNRYFFQYGEMIRLDVIDADRPLKQVAPAVVGRHFQVIRMLFRSTVQRDIDLA